MESTDGNNRRRAKIGHRKSRNGCRICKSRRVKCDETRPVCGKCDRLKLECAWPDSNSNITSRRPGSHQSSSGPLLNPSSQTGTGPGVSPATNAGAASREPSFPVSGELLFPSFDSSEEIILPESRARRMLEHRLMQHYMHNMTKPFPLSPGQAWFDLFAKRIPRLALEYDNVLYTVLANAAKDLLHQDPHNAELATACHSYLLSAVHEQREMVNKLTTANADAVCMASLLLLVHSWAALQDRSLEPYSPPLQWVQMGRGAGALIWMSVEALRRCTEAEKENTCVLLMANGYPRFSEDVTQSYFDPGLRVMFNGVLTQKLSGSGDIWDDETREAYEKTLSFVGSIQAAIDHGEPVYAIYRRVQSFALMVPPKFFEFLEEQRPRALVILAHFFATVAQLPSVWWIGDGEGGQEPTVQREIRAIQKVLPVKWASQMVWPLDITGLR